MRVIAPRAIIRVPMMDRTTSGVTLLRKPVDRVRRGDRLVRGLRVAADRVEERGVPRVAIR